MDRLMIGQKERDMGCTFEMLPRRIFLDSCTAQTLRDYGDYIYEGEPVEASDRIYRIPEGIANVESLRNIFLINQRAQFEWIVSRGSLVEALDKKDPAHETWFRKIAAHSAVCLKENGSTPESESLAMQLCQPKFGYLSEKDRLLLREAIHFQCEAFLTMERRLPRNAVHIARLLNIQILTPIMHWSMLKPWAALWC